MKQRCLYAIKTTKIQRERLDNNQCPTCGKSKSEWNRRTDWRCCCVKCTKKFEKTLRLFWSDIRLKAFKRDNFTCVKCGDNRKEVEVTVISKWPVNIEAVIEGKEKKLREEKRESKEVRTNLIGDHIIPIALGGDEWDLKNIQTLCIKCNKIKTKKDAKNIAKQRAIEKKLTKGQKKLK